MPQHSYNGESIDRSRRRLLKAAGIALLSSTAILKACDFFATSSAGDIMRTRHDDTLKGLGDYTGGGKVPLLDRDRAEDFETATFGLG